MTKGIRMTCQQCNMDQDVTELVAHDVLGVPYRTAQRFLANYRELVDPKDVYVHRLRAHQETGAKMFELLKKVSIHHERYSATVEEIRLFVKSVEKPKKVWSGKWRER